MNALLHAVGVVNFGFAVYYDLAFVHLPPHLKGKKDFDGMAKFPGKFKYLTMWNMVLQFVYFTIALLNDVAGDSAIISKKQSKLQKLRDYLFASWAFPIGVFVSLSFWILYGIDRAMVFPKEMDDFFPSWLNHAVHTVPIAIMVVESYAVPKIFPPRSTAALANLFFSGGYSVWIVWVNHVSGVWAYPLLQILNNYQRSVFIMACMFAILSCYFLGEYLNNSIWGKDHPSKLSTVKVKKSNPKRKVK